MINLIAFCGVNTSFFVNSPHSVLMLITVGVPQGSIWGCVLLNVLVNDLEKEMECTVFKFADDIEVGSAVDMLEDRAALQT